MLGKRIHLKQFAIGALMAALGAGTYVIAAVSFSNFTAGTTISASEMNAKLNALKDAVNAVEATCPANTPTRFTDKGDGTICDGQTGLMWEKKTGTVGPSQQCEIGICFDPHDVNNVYFWTAVGGGTEPNGRLFTDFLAKLNDLEQPNDGTATTCFAGHCDWRIPTAGELRSLLQGPNPNCPANPCIAAGFPGPIKTDLPSWSFTSGATQPQGAWAVFFSDGFVLFASKFFEYHVLAVRGVSR
jgi:uncharacterized protein DUF1566